MKPVLLAAAVFLAACPACFGQVKYDRTVHDFGDLTQGDGPQSCTFTLTNTGREPVSIVSVVSSCGCTGAKWTREAIAPGAKGLIEASYSNDEGPYPFDKTLTVYTSASKKPAVLHLKGYVHKTRMPLSETHPVHIGPLGFRSDLIKAGFMSQGGVKSGEISVANLGREPLEVSFTDVPEQVTAGSATIAPGEARGISYSVYASRSLWGRNEYPLTPVVNGVPQKRGSVVLWAVTKEDFSGWTEQQKARAACPEFDRQSFSAGPVHSGERVEGSFTLSNSGKSDLIIYKVDCDSPYLSFRSPDGSVVRPGASLVLPFTLDTSGRTADADNLAVLTVYSNSPKMPVAYLYVSCVIVK